MKSSVLNNKYVEIDVQFCERDGWQVPAVFQNIDSEYQTTRYAVTLMERPYSGRMVLTGSDHLDLLHRITCNEVRRLKNGEGQVNIFPNEKGRIVSRVILLRFDDAIHLICPAVEIPKLTEWIERYVFIEEVHIENLSDSHTTFSLCGPLAASLLKAAFGSDLTDLPQEHHRPVEFRGNDLLCFSSSELSVPVFNVIVPETAAGALWDFLMAKGADFDIAPIGEHAFDILRVEAGWPVAGKDFDEQVNPHEAGMVAYVDFDKGCYIGQEVIARLDTYEKVQKHLTGIRIIAEDRPEENATVSLAGQEIGQLTSVVYSPSLRQHLALAYIRTKYLEPDAEVTVVSGDHAASGRLTTLPFAP